MMTITITLHGNRNDAIMKKRSKNIMTAAVVLAMLLPMASVQGQVDQRVLAQHLLGENKQERDKAFEIARRIEKESMNPELRAALVSLLERMNGIVLQAAKQRKALVNFENPEFIAKVSRVVAELGDPQAIPTLSQAIYGGLTVIRALAAFGEQAAPSVLGVVTSPDSHYDLVNHGLITLRFMVETVGTRALSTGTIARTRSAAAQRMTGKQHFSTLLWAIDLAVILNDEELRKIVKALAEDRNEVIARGIKEEYDIQQIQKRAADRLAGVPPLPRP